ncbi:MAG: hypothetical protein K2X39_10635 [Silvanigrellaceae bacterium]|nr:hypothetical protein [Silvanigrellaceae bacterium]
MTGFFGSKNANGPGLIDPKKVLNPADVNDKALINQCILDVQEKLAELKKMDMKITVSISAGVCFWAGAFIAPIIFSTVAIGSIGYGLYQLGAREKLNEEYQEALRNLIACSNCLADSGYINDKCEQSATILRLLAPLVSDEQLSHLSGECHQFLKDSQEDRNSFSSTLNHKLYGFERGGPVDILSALWSATVQGLKNIIHQIFPDMEKDIISSVMSSQLP